MEAPSLQNTIPLQEEVERRMGADFLPYVTHEEIENERKIRHERFVLAGGVQQTVRIPDCHYPEGKSEFEPMPKAIGAGKWNEGILYSHGISSATKMSYLAVSGQLADERNMRLQPVREKAQEQLRVELRNGILIAYERTSHGLEGPIPKTNWDGTIADTWLSSGMKNGNELRLAMNFKAPIDSGAPNDGGRNRLTAWFLANIDGVPPQKRGKNELFAIARIEIPGVTKAAFKHARTKLIEQRPDLRLSNAGRRTR